MLSGFSACALAVWIAGTRLSFWIDTLSDRLNLAKSIAGLLILATATSLPEIATTLFAALENAPVLLMTNLFGGIALQASLLALADMLVRGSLTNYPRKAGHALEATLLILLVALTGVFLALKEPVALGHVGGGAVLIGLTYAAAIWLLRYYDPNNDWVPVDAPDMAEAEPVKPADIAQSNRRLAALSVLASLVILVAGLGLVYFATALAAETGIGRGVIGATLLALATSLPEVSTTLAAVRIGSYTLALSNIFGSNLIMIGLVFPADLLTLDGPILSHATPEIWLALFAGIGVHAVFLTGLIVRRKPRFGRIGLDSLVVLAFFSLSLAGYASLAAHNQGP